MWPPASGCLTQPGSETGRELAQDRKHGWNQRKPGTREGQLRVGPVAYLQVWAGLSEGGSVLVTPEGTVLQLLSSNGQGGPFLLILIILLTLGFRDFVFPLSTSLAVLPLRPSSLLCLTSQC